MSTSGQQRRLETSTGILTLRDDGIVHWESKPDAAETLATAKECIAGIETISGNRPVPFLSDIRRLRSADRAARQHYASDDMAAATIAIALVIESGFSKVIGNFYIGFNKPPMPTRLFTSVNEGLEWLRGFVE